MAPVLSRTKEEWRYASQAIGRLYAMTTGMIKMQLLYVLNWDMHVKVCIPLIWSCIDYRASTHNIMLGKPYNVVANKLLKPRHSTL